MFYWYGGIGKSHSPNTNQTCKTSRSCFVGLLCGVFALQDAPFSFHGQLPGDSNKKTLAMKSFGI